MRLVNSDLLSNPINWIVVFAVFAISIAGFLVVYSHATKDA